MSHTNFIKTELAAAIARGVRQCVVIASGPQLQGTLSVAPDAAMRVFVVDEDVTPDTAAATFVPTQFASETLAEALEKSDFDKLKASLFVWLGGAGYRALDGVMGTLGFIASLPKGTGVVFDYVAKRAAIESLTNSALDALASRVSVAGSPARYLIQPQAVMALLSSLGFRQVADLANQELLGSNDHLVSAVV